MNGVDQMIKLQAEKGLIYITSNVFANLVGDAATSCFGVKGMAKRSLNDGLVHLLKREAMSKGIYISYEDDAAVSIELHIIVDRGVNIPALCRSIIQEVKYKVKTVTGVDVNKVNVFIDSISAD